eukprot:TRINITY_DN9100_c0_g1_i5.p1 TRINITY_DN9100_c0_g1~~TRINITY_DN9100_c0_g1_i5.p1  ORF type:complete len:413 (-),score=101.36 TRINITY_DN9100_c0_g1_i5:29-1267(-)
MACRVYVGSLNYDLNEEHIRGPFAPFGTIAKIDMPKEASGRSKGFCFVEYTTPEAANAALNAMNGYSLAGRPIKVGRPTQTGGMSIAPPVNPLATPLNPVLQLQQAQAVQAAQAAQAAHALSSVFPGINMGSMNPVNPASGMSSVSLAALNAVNKFGGPNLPLPLPPGSLVNGANAAAAAAAAAAQPKENKKRIYVGSIFWELTPEHVKSVFEAFGTIVSCTLMPNPDTGKHKGFGFIEYADEKSAEDAIANMNGFELCGRQLRVGRSHTSDSVMPSDVIAMSIQDPTKAAVAALQAQARAMVAQNDQAAKPLPKTCKCILLKNMIGRNEVDPDLEVEVREECENYGEVKQVVVHIDKKTSNDDEAVLIFVKFASPEAASRARSQLDKRFFGGRVVKAEFFDDGKFDRHEFA